MKKYLGQVKSDFACLQRYDHETEGKADCGVPEVWKRLKFVLF